MAACNPHLLGGEQAGARAGSAGRGTAAGLPWLSIRSRASLCRLISATARPSSDPIRVRLAGLFILVAGMIGRIGAQTLEALVGSRQFLDLAKAINERSPIPEVVLAAFSEAVPSARPPLPDAARDRPDTDI